MTFSSHTNYTAKPPDNLPKPGDEQAINTAYQAFMRAKHPGEKPPDGVFKWFDPDDDIPDQGMGFVNTPRELMLAPRGKIGPIMLIKVARNTHRQPQQAGWYLKLMASWCYIAPTAAACVKRFDELKAEVSRRR